MGADAELAVRAPYRDGPSGDRYRRTAIAAVPSALRHADELASRLARGGAVFLDYDGTLTPIVADPEEAHLSAETREVIGELARHVPVAVISGRVLGDVRARVELDRIYYAGSHGFEISFPNGSSISATT